MLQPEFYFFIHLIILSFNYVIYCYECYWRVNIRKNSEFLHIAEVHFYHKGRLLSGSLFNFTASSYANSIIIGNQLSGPPEAANDNNIYTFYHSCYDDGYPGNCFPDSNPALYIDPLTNITFDTLRIVNRQDLDGDNNNYYYRLIGATVAVYDSEGIEIFQTEIKSGLSSYKFYIRNNSEIVRWSPLARKCEPDVCSGSNLLEIPGYNGAITTALVQDTIIYDTIRTRECFRDKYIVLIGDSSVTELLHDMVILLNRLATDDANFQVYLDCCVSHKKLKECANIEDKSTNSTMKLFLVSYQRYLLEGNSQLELDSFTGHRNMTFLMPSYRIRIRHRFNGHRDLGGDGEGISSMLADESADEFKCLLGDPHYTQCQQPDIILVQSGFHDVGHDLKKTREGISEVIQQLRETRKRGSAVYWMATTDYHNLNVLKDLNAYAKEMCEDRDSPTIQYIDRAEAATRFYNELYDNDYIKKLNFFGRSHPHIGAIEYREDYDSKKFVLSSYLTQFALSHLCS